MDAIRDRIIDTSLDLFALEGCRRITMDQIANDVHISKRTLYQHFASKEVLLDACLSIFLKKIDEERKLITHNTKDPVMLALAMNQHHAEFCKKYSRLMRDTENYYPEIFKKHFSYTMDEVIAKIEQWLNDAAGKGLIRPHVNLKVAANTIVYFTELIRKRHDLEIELQNEINREFIFTYMRGLLSEESIIRYSKKEASFHDIVK